MLWRGMKIMSLAKPRVRLGKMNGGGMMQTLIRKIYLDKNYLESKIEVFSAQKIIEDGETRYYLKPDLYLPGSSLNRDIIQSDGITVRWEMASQEDNCHSITL
ncbi:hypothetical protein GECvBGOT_gp143c [Salmonella phage GEC_vB_GOT]|nr:hypothetical protein GECvBGOT_gp143c [Salmonella phage GEC_vB_GOT]